MHVASFCSFPLGIVRWRGAGPMLTVIVKATFSLAADGEAAVTEYQDPLRLDEPLTGPDDGGLWYASDFAPRKARADVVLVGHAHAPAPASSIAARVTVDVLDKAFVARAAPPSTRIPLLPGHIWASDAPGAAAIAVGPRAAWSLERAALPGGDLVDERGVPNPVLGPRFDFQFFNVAPADQQLGLLRPNASMSFAGLLPGAPRRQVWLPGHRPRVFHFGARGPGERAQEVQLAIDTMWIHTDEEVCVLTWRGVVQLAQCDEAPTALVLAVEPRGAARGWTALRDKLDLATTIRAIEPSPGGVSEVDPSRVAEDPRPYDIDDEPTTATDGDDAAADREPTTAIHVGRDKRARDAPSTPPPNAAPPALSERTGTLTSTMVAEAGAAKEPLPFRRGLGFRLGAWAAQGPPTNAAPTSGPKRLPLDATHTEAALVITPKPELPFGKSRSAPPAPDESTSAMMDVDKLRRSAVPFGEAAARGEARSAPQAGTSADRASDEEESTADVPANASKRPRGRTLPFSALREPPEDLTVDEPGPFRAGARGTLPFQRAVDVGLPPLPARSPSPSPLPMPPLPPFVTPPRASSADASTAPRRAAPSSPGAAPPAPPAPARASAPPPPRSSGLLPVSTYAAVKAAVWEGTPLVQALSPFGLDEVAWRHNELLQVEALAKEAREGKSTLALALAEAVQKARAGASRKDAR